MDVRRLVVVIRKWALLAVVGVALGALAGLGATSLMARVYEARATLIVGQSLTSASPDYAGLLASQQLTATYAAIATTRPQLDAVIADLRLATTPDDLLRRVTAGAAAGSTLLEITAQDADPARAAAIANALAARLVSATSTPQGRQQDLQAAIDADLQATQEQILAVQAQVTALTARTDRTAEEETKLDTLEGRLVTMRATYATLLGYSTAGSTNMLSVVEPAAAPLAPISPRGLLNVLIGAVLGLFAAAGITLLARYLDDSVGSAEEVERLTDATILASVGVIRDSDDPRAYRELAGLLHPRSAIGESYRMLRANIEFAAVDSGLRSLLVASAGPAEGKTVTAMNLGIVFAQAGRRVLLVDADLRHPTLQAPLGLRNDIGLTTALVVGDLTAEGLAQPTPQPNLWVLTSGPIPPNPAELLGSRRMRALLEQAQDAFDLVIIDTAPLGIFADAAVLSSAATDTLLVVDATRSRRRAVAAATEVLARAGANLLGVVRNRAPGVAADLAMGYGARYRQAFAPLARMAAAAAHGGAENGSSSAVEAGTQPSSDAAEPVAEASTAEAAATGDPEAATPAAEAAPEPVADEATAQAPAADQNEAEPVAEVAPEPAAEAAPEPAADEAESEVPPADAPADADVHAVAPDAGLPATQPAPEGGSPGGEAITIPATAADRPRADGRPPRRRPARADARPASPAASAATASTAAPVTLAASTDAPPEGASPTGRSRKAFPAAARPEARTPAVPRRRPAKGASAATMPTAAPATAPATAPEAAPEAPVAVPATGGEATAPGPDAAAPATPATPRRRTRAAS